MKLFLDENLSRKLVRQLTDLYPSATHVAEAGLLQSPDFAIWEYAKARDLIIVSTDSDFFDLATTLGPPPKVIWLRRWTHPTRDAEAALRKQVIRIAKFAADPEQGLLILERD